MRVHRVEPKYSTSQNRKVVEDVQNRFCAEAWTPVPRPDLEASSPSTGGLAGNA